MNDGGDRAKIIRCGLNAAQEAGGLVATCRRNLGNADLATCLVERQDVGKGAADIDADDDRSVHDPAPLAGLGDVTLRQIMLVPRLHLAMPHRHSRRRLAFPDARAGPA